MAITIDETVGGASANSFVTEVEFITRMTRRLNVPTGTTVEPATTCSDTEKIALMEAAREFDLLLWQGTRVDSTQALSWPRDEVVNPDLPWATQEPADTYYFLTTVIPDRIKDAQIELAMEFIKLGTVDLASVTPNIEVKREKIDVLETEWYEAHQRVKGLSRFPRVVKLIRPLLDPSLFGGPRVVRT